VAVGASTVVARALTDFSQNGRPFIIVRCALRSALLATGQRLTLPREQGKKVRTHGLDATRVSCSCVAYASNGIADARTRATSSLRALVSSGHGGDLAAHLVL
jgi:hypothetical protein